MEAKELRLGNMIKGLDGYTHVVTEISAKEVVSEAIDYGSISTYAGGASMDPIALTEEWLLKFGFEIKYGNVFIKGGYDLEPLFTDSDEWEFCINEAQAGTSIKYVHELQNLYYALTGDELTIKEQ